VTVYNSDPTHASDGSTYGFFSGTLLVKGVAAGSSTLVLQDPIGDETSATFNGGVPLVGTFGTVIEGTTYDQSDMPDFTFSVPVASLTDVTVNFNTSGSTLPSSLMGPLSSDTVSIPAGQTNLFVPFTPNDSLVDNSKGSGVFKYDGYAINDSRPLWTILLWRRHRFRRQPHHHRFHYQREHRRLR